MKRTPLALGAIVLASMSVLAHGPNVHSNLNVDFYLAVDAPTDVPLPLPSTTILPWNLARHRLVAPEYTLSLAPAPDLQLPLPATIDACHPRSNGDWLFSTEVAMDDPSGGGTLFLPEDVVVYDAAVGSYSHLFCGDLFGIPDGANIDAAFIRGQIDFFNNVIFQLDDGNLVLSFDVPTTVPGAGGTIFMPGDLVELTRIGPACSDWLFVARLFDSAAAGLPSSTNVTGADERGGIGTGGPYRLVLTFDVPTTIGATTYLPGDLVAYNPVTGLWDPAPYHRDPLWPVGQLGYATRINALCFPAPPGRIPCFAPVKLEIGKGPGPGQMTLFWNDSCSTGAEDYGIHEGTIGNWYSHDDIDCTDNGADRVEAVNWGPGDHYYLVVPYNANDDGSYGERTVPPLAPPTERPVSGPFPNCEPNQTDMRELGCP